jgi:hypothetical protein
LRGRPSLEVHRRIDRLLAAVDAGIRAPEGLRVQRATAVLERVGSAEARRILTVLARGAPGALVTEEAKAALSRLARRPVR